MSKFEAKRQRPVKDRMFDKKVTEQTHYNNESLNQSSAKQDSDSWKEFVREDNASRAEVKKSIPAPVTHDYHSNKSHLSKSSALDKKEAMDVKVSAFEDQDAKIEQSQELELDESDYLVVPVS